MFGVAALALACAACGGDNSSTSEQTPPPLPSPSRTADEGCTDVYPNRLGVEGRIAGLLIACASDDGTSLLVKNTTSATVLDIRPSDDTADSTRMSVAAADSPSFKELAVNDATPLYCSAYFHFCLVTPSSTLTAASSGPVHLTAEVDKVATAKATAANSAAGYVQGKLTSRASRYVNGIKACAEDAGKAMQSHDFVEDAVRDVFAASAACGSLMDSVAREANEAPPLPASSGEQVMRYAGKYTADLRRDFSVYEAIRLISHVRR